MPKTKTTDVRLYNRSIRRYFADALASSGIPTFCEFSKDPNILSNYLLRRDTFYLPMLGEKNIRVMDATFTYAFAKEIVESIMGDRCLEGLPGNWNEVTISPLIMAMANLVTPSDDPAGPLYLTWRNRIVGTTAEDLQNDRNSFMIAAYTPEKLYTFRSFIYTNAITSIIQEVEEKYPIVSIRSARHDMTIQYGKKFIEAIQENLDGYANWRKNNPDAEYTETVDKFGEYLNLDVVKFLTALLYQSGLNPEICAPIFKRCTVGFTIGGKITAKRDILSKAGVPLIYHLIYQTEKGDAAQQVDLTSFKSSDIVVFTQDNIKSAKEERKTQALARIGTALDTAVLNYVKFILNVYISENNLNGGSRELEQPVEDETTAE